ncbi:hypothetical protein [uncultured Shewanella sp.]|uniref:hypothetical protein n=1 Tax=uncultured Shewanella sp. TaxID=173975 RepID=UPI00261B6D50|nr:hypothetical protein [uncultured Shewanella sp.]
MSDKIIYSSNATLEKVVEHGFEIMKENDCEGFEYVVGNVKEGQLKVTFKPDKSVYDVVNIDGVNGFGYTLAFEDSKGRK